MAKQKYTLVFATILLLFFVSIRSVASGYASEKPSRQTDITVTYTQYEWWMLKWSNNELRCQIFTDHEGLPTSDDIFVYCGNDLYNKWIKTDACPAITESEKNISDCNGFYLHPVSSEVLTKTVHVDLPLPEAWIAIDGCSPQPPNNYCEELPNLIISGIEPLPNENITAIQGTYNDIPFMCEGDICKVPMRPTPLEGVNVEFWAESSFGDETEHYSALVRVIDTGVSESPGEKGWFIDMISSRWAGEQVGSCGQIWGAFPPIGGSPEWLSSPESSQLLASDEPYMFLAGRLISQGIIDALDCPNMGLEENGYANICGLEKAREEVDRWQNQFDTQIIEVAKETGVPGQLIKNLFALESQFWPGAFNNAKEFGLGQLTELGADTILLWNETFFNQFCPLVLDADTCSLGYAQLNEENQATLRGAVAMNASAYCTDCPAGIDLSHADFSIQLFAQTLQANCEQTGHIITNITGKSPGEVSTYEDLWKFTLANYHAGPGCLMKAIKSVPSGTPINWETTAQYLETDCPGTVDYVKQISK
ncbi:MAG TPA: hypothetical protein G4N95_01135 [Anaerolineae bacterium]|nr:hypothetical protein [Anaerolineae bacterium]